MKRILIAFMVCGAVVAGAAAVTAQNDIVFPVEELGNCADRNACKTYCDDLAHKDACVAFARAHGLISEEEAEEVKKLPKEGPGECRSAIACKAYCADPAHQDECIAFAEKHDIKTVKGKEVRERAKLIKEQGGPGKCQSTGECRAYCENPAHQDECIAFAKKHKIVSSAEITMMEQKRELVKKILSAGGPGGCNDEKECNAYCANPAHVEECLAFSVEHGGIEKEEAEEKLREFIHRAGEAIRPMLGTQATTTDARFKKMEAERLEKFKQFRELEERFRKSATTTDTVFSSGPGGCASPEACIKYCSDPKHRDECAKFNPSVGGLPPGELFRQAEPGSTAGYEGKLEDMRQCGPRPAMPTPIGCKGPFCEDGKWDFECEDSDSSSERDTPLFRTQEGSEGEDEEREPMEACTKEYKPVCGANNRTYPNECYAKREGIKIIKGGACEMIQGEGKVMPRLPLELKQIQPQSRGVFDVLSASVLGSLRGILWMK